MSKKDTLRLNNLPFLLAFLTPFILLSPVFLSGKALFWGTPLLQFVPWWSFAWKTVAAGHLPLWNPLVGMGAPLLANYQSGLLYPPYWAHFAMWMIGGTRLMAWGLAPVAGFHLFMAGWGMVALTKRLKLNVASQIVSSLAFGLSGYLVARLGFFSINSAAAWLPWVLLPLTPEPGCNFSFNRRSLGILVFSLSMLLLAGHAQSAWYILLLAVLWFGFWNFQDQGRITEWGWKERISHISHAWGFWLLALVIALGICSAQLLPTAEYLAQSQRAESVGYEFAMNYSFWPWHFLNFLNPGLFGSPAAGDFWGFGNYWEDAVYIGLLPLLLAFSAILKLIPKNGFTSTERKLSLFLLAVLAISVLFSLGANTPLYPWLFKHVPTFDMFQAPTRWMLWAVFCLALLAGIGAHHWRRPQGWGLYWLRLGLAGSFAVSIAAGYLSLTSDTIHSTFIRSVFMMGLLGAGSGLLGLTAPPAETKPTGISDGPTKERKDDSKRERQSFLLQLKPPPSQPQNRSISQSSWEIMLGLFLAADMLIAGWGLNPGESTSLYGLSPSAEKIRLLAGSSRAYYSPEDEDHLKYQRFFQFKTYHPGEDWGGVRLALLPNTNILDEIAFVNNYDPFMPGRAKGWADHLVELGADAQEKMLRLMDVGVILVPQADSQDGISLKKLDGKRLRFIVCSLAADNDQKALSLLSQPGFDIEKTVVLTKPDSKPGKKCLDGSAVNGTLDNVVIQDLSDPANPNRSDYLIDTPQAGWLVISDVWYPGWLAWVDGAPAQLLQADYLFRVIEIPEGKHRVAVVYRPKSFEFGAGMSIFSLVVFWFMLRRFPK